MLVRRCTGLASCSCCGARNSASASVSTRLSRRRPLPCVRPAVVTGSPHTGSAPPATRTLLRFYHQRGHPPAAWAAAPLPLQLPTHQASRLGRGLASSFSSSSGHPKVGKPPYIYDCCPEIMAECGGPHLLVHPRTSTTHTNTPGGRRGGSGGGTYRG